ncbi:hypothetical protein ACHHYP_00604 [Achlya hypogyna]|uniref:Uncharacterized protein n=1 Tax=Achlya hypogyna TaxID=1202772 RepID=A0A1V9ZUF3_ACHHY|nr:hypothetical protein ACHHYP_00604 [Achlya hypogyna]
MADGTLLTRERSCIFETRVETAAACKEAGATAQKAGDRATAVECYERALYHVDFDEGTWAFELLDQHRDAVNAVRLPVYLNLAACYLDESLLDTAKVIEYGDLALAIEKDNVKALYRKGQAYLAIKDGDAAAVVLKKAAVLQPNDKAIRGALAQSKELQTLAREEEKKRWGGHLLKTTESVTAAPVAGTPTNIVAWWSFAVGVVIVAIVVALGVGM